jgi:hypothetical protein
MSTNPNDIFDAAVFEARAGRIPPDAGVSDEWWNEWKAEVSTFLSGRNEFHHAHRVAVLTRPPTSILQKTVLCSLVREHGFETDGAGGWVRW